MKEKTLREKNGRVNAVVRFADEEKIYNRFFEKKRDFIALRKIGFQTKDLMKIAGMKCCGVEKANSIKYNKTRNNI
ncbi:hypothetical protein C808_00765 [Lachnospiraceae bacterium M18-1]|nr:hypothetical protein C808_00765 [Lachnospiraceae bacterium M18-1]